MGTLYFLLILTPFECEDFECEDFAWGGGTLTAGKIFANLLADDRVSPIPDSEVESESLLDYTK